MSTFEGLLRTGQVQFNKEIYNVALAKLLKDKNAEIETLRALVQAFMDATDSPEYRIPLQNVRAAALTVL